MDITNDLLCLFLHNLRRHIVRESILEYAYTWRRFGVMMLCPMIVSFIK